MLRTPTLTFLSLLLALGLLPGAVLALGLGGMRTQSALNQPFYAEIELFDVRVDELDTVKVRLASRDEFAEAGAERPHFLTRLRFTPMIGADGGPIVQVTSREPIREPYLDFLVEVLWPQGRLVKEFTVLMDPPATRGGSAPRVSPPRSAAPVRRAPPTQRPSEPPPPPLRRPASPEPAEPAAPQASNVQAARPTPSPQPVPPQAAGLRFPLHYGPVPSGAGLWRIARGMTPPGATVAQTALALYRNNQEAFVRGNINLLKVNADLYIPTAQELFALDAATAERQFQDAMAGRSVPNAPITDIPAQPQLRIAGAQPPAAMPSTAEPPAPAAPETIGELEQEMLRVRETSEVNRQETTELRDRIRELEQQLTDIRRLLEVRNDQLAQLQTAVREDPARAGELAQQQTPPATAGAAGSWPPETSDVPPPAPIVDPELAGSDTLPAGRELLPSPPPPAATAAMPGAEQSGTVAASGDDAAPRAPAEPPRVAANDSAQGQQAADATQTGQQATATAEPVPAPEAPALPATQAQAPKQGMLTAVTDAVPLWALGAGLGGIGLGALGLLAYRRRRQLSETEPDSALYGLDHDTEGDAIPDGADAAAEPGAVSEKRPDEDSLAIELDSLPDSLPEQAASAPPERVDPPLDVQTGLPINVASNLPRGMSAETQEADVIAEADIYILYGRYREAESILLDELKQAPDRTDLRYKLAEALIGSGNREALLALMEQMKEAGEDGRDPAKWATIEQGFAAMKPQPGETVAGDAEPPAAAPVSTPSSASPEPSLRSLDLGAGKGKLGTEDLADSEDTGLGFSVREVSPSSAENLQAQLDNLELDLKDLDDLGDLDPDSKTGVAADAGAAAPLPDAPAVESPKAPAAGNESTGLGEDLDLDLGDLENLANLDESSPPPDLTAPVPAADDSEALSPLTEPPDVRDVAAERPASSAPADPPLETNLDVAPHPARAAEAAPSPDAGGAVADSISSDVLSSQWRMDSGLWDEAATKMDLARAYVEMEDPDAARGILEEVALEGNEDQQAEAKAMLAKLG